MEGERGRLYIGGLPMETIEADLMEYFSRYCEVRDANIVAGRNYGFVTLVDESMIDQILGEENVILGRRVVVNRARRRNNANDRSVQTSLLGFDLLYPCSSFYYPFPHFCAWPYMTRPVQYIYYQSVYGEVVENRARPRNNRNDRSVLGYDLVYPYSSFYDPFPHCCARPYMTRQVQHNYYQRMFQVGESSGSPSSIVPSSSAPVSAVSSPRRDAESTVQDNFFDCAEDFSSGVSTESTTEEDEDDLANSSEVAAKSEEDNFDNGLSLSCNGGDPRDTQSNTEEDDDDLANSSEVAAKSEEDKVDDGLSLSCNGGDPRDTQSNTEKDEDDLANSSEVAAKSEEDKVDDGLSLSSNGGNPCADSNGKSTS